MPLTRREFVAGLGAAGALATLPRTTHAAVAQPLLYPPMDLSAFDAPLHHGDPVIHPGCSAITWGDKALPAIEDIAAAGFSGIQLRAPVIDQYPDPHALRDVLAAHNLTFVALSSGVASIDPALRASQLELHTAHAKYAHEAGAHYIQLIASNSSPTAAHTAADYKLQGEVFTEIGKRAADYGIKLGFHNHMNSVGQPPEAIDAILDASDPNYLFLELDVAHCLQGGGDPAATIRKWGKRILFMHFKDVHTVPTGSGYEWLELGTGRVDFPAVIAALHDVHFRGWAIVELDRVPAGQTLTAKEANAQSLHYLREKFGVEA